MRHPCGFECWLVLAGLLVAACNYTSHWEGRYAAPETQMTLWLQAEGRAQWTVKSETTLLRWEERRGALWLHTKTGAVMIALPRENGQALEIEVPAVGRLAFRKLPS